MRIVFKHLPLDIHQHAMGAALASEAARKQGKFWQLHDKMFENQSKLTLNDIKGYAKEIGLDMARFEKDLLDLSLKKRVDDDVAEARTLGVTGTPGFFINGRFTSGAKPFEAFAQMIDEELTRLRIPLPTKPAN